MKKHSKYFRKAVTNEREGRPGAWAASLEEMGWGMTFDRWWGAWALETPCARSGSFLVLPPCTVTPSHTSFHSHLPTAGTASASTTHPPLTPHPHVRVHFQRKLNVWGLSSLFSAMKQKSYIWIQSKQQICLLQLSDSPHGKPSGKTSIP